MNIPEHWENIEFEKIISTISTYKKLRKKDIRSEAKFPVISQGETDVEGYTNQENKIYTNNLPIILFGDHTKRVKFLDFSFAIVGDGVKLLKPINILNIKYIFYFLFSINLPDEGYSRYFSYLKKIKIPLPPIKEQKAIADKLDNELSILKEKKEKIEKSFNEKYLMFTEEVLDDIFTPKQKWQKKKIEDVQKFLGSGKTPRGGKSNYLLKGIPFIRSQNVLKNRLDLSDVAFISEAVNEEMKRTQVKPNDLLLNITGASIGRATVVPSDFKIGNVNQHVCIIRLNDEVKPQFLSYFLNSKYGQKQINDKQDGVTREGLNYSQVKSLEFYLPSKPHQAEIVKKIEQSFQNAEKLKAEFEKTIAQIEKHEKILLEKAFTGKLCEPIPNDTAVSELLEEIKKEKLSFEKQQKILQKKRRNMPKPPKLTDKEFIKIIVENFEDKDFDFEELIQIVNSKKIIYNYDDLQELFFDGLRKPIDKKDKKSFLIQKFNTDNEKMTFSINK